jgi:hypothetical protein
MTKRYRFPDEGPQHITRKIMPLAGVWAISIKELSNIVSFLPLSSSLFGNFDPYVIMLETRSLCTSDLN